MKKPGNSRGKDEESSSKFHRAHPPTTLKQTYVLLRAEASSWRRRKFKSLLLTLMGTLLIVFFLWSFERTMDVFQTASSSDVVGTERLGDGTTIPSCTNDVFMDREHCYTVIYAPNTTEFRDIVGKLGVADGEVRGFASGVDMDAHLYEHPNTVLAAVEFFKENSTRYAFSVQTNGTARWFKGTFFSMNEYVQLPVIVGVQRAMARFLDGKGLEIGLRISEREHGFRGPDGYVGLDGRDGIGPAAVDGPAAPAGLSNGTIQNAQRNNLLPLFFISSCILILMMQVHEMVEKHGVIDVLEVQSLRRTAHFLALVVTWSNICLWNSLAFVGAYSLFYIKQIELTLSDVSLMVSCGQVMMALGLIVGACLRRKGPVLGIGFFLFFWSWVSMVSGLSGMYKEYVTPWGLLVVGLCGEGGWSMQALMWVLAWGYTLVGWVLSVRAWAGFGRWNVSSDAGVIAKSGVIVKVDHLRKRFGATLALDDVSLELTAGHEKVVLGTCSAGKSTLIKCILDEQCPYVRRLPGTMVGYCPQETQLLDYLTVDEWLGLVRAIRGLEQGDHGKDGGYGSAEDSDNNGTKMKAIEDNRVIWELDAGERRWVSLQTAMVGMLSPSDSASSSHRNALVLLDEPTSEMSPKRKRMTWKKIQELKQAGCSVLISTHDVDEAERGDEIIVLSRGMTVFTGTELELRRRFGCGYQLNIRVASSMVQKVQNIVVKTLGGKAVNHGSPDGYCTFDVPHEMEDRLPGLLTTLDMNKSIFGVEDVQLRSATISNSFMSLIRQVELEAAVREGRYELLLVAEEGIALKIPIGSDLVESPSGNLYQLAWSTDPLTGKLTIASYTGVAACAPAGSPPR